MRTDGESICKVSHFQERDIDLFLAEELRINSEFSRWFVSQGDRGFECRHPAVSTEINVVEDGSEADVAALFQDDQGRRFRLFVENKITASKMPEQLERYIRRARNEEARGEIAGWVVKLFSPGGYWDKHCPNGVQNITFEDAAEFLRSSSTDRRAAYKADFLSAAAIIRGGSQRDAHNADTQPFIKEFWDEVYERLEERFPGYFIHKTRYPVSLHFAPGTHGFPIKLLRIDFKGDKGEVALAFKDCDPEKLARVLKDIPDVPGEMIVNSKSTSLRISGLPSFTIADGVSVIDEKVIPAYEATHRLIEFWKEHEGPLREAFDD